MPVQLVLWQLPVLIKGKRVVPTRQTEVALLGACYNKEKPAK
jgi:hypothetical protein